MDWETTQHRDQIEQFEVKEQNNTALERVVAQYVEKMLHWPVSAIDVLQAELSMEPNDSVNTKVYGSSKRMKENVDDVNLENRYLGEIQKEAKIMRLDDDFEKPTNCQFHLLDVYTVDANGSAQSNSWKRYGSAKIRQVQDI